MVGRKECDIIKQMPRFFERGIVVYLADPLISEAVADIVSAVHKAAVAHKAVGAVRKAAAAAVRRVAAVDRNGAAGDRTSAGHRKADPYRAYRQDTWARAHIDW